MFPVLWSVLYNISIRYSGLSVGKCLETLASSSYFSNPRVKKDMMIMIRKRRAHSNKAKSVNKLRVFFQFFLDFQPLTYFATVFYSFSYGELQI